MAGGLSCIVEAAGVSLVKLTVVVAVVESLYSF